MNFQTAYRTCKYVIRFSYPYLCIFALLIQFIISCSQVGVKKPSKFAILSLNIFDQQQGSWSNHFRSDRLKSFSSFVNNFGDLQIIFLQESQAIKEKNSYQSTDAKFLKKFPYIFYSHESVEKDGFSYGYLIASKIKPRRVWTHPFHFKGGSKRILQLSLWDLDDSSCVGVANLHLSWQSSEIRVKEAQMIVNKIKDLQNVCNSWLLVGDFNGDEKSKEMNIFFNNKFNNLFPEKLKPTVGPFNPIRSIYGKIQHQTIDWTLGYNFVGKSKVILDTKRSDGVWISDHAAVLTTFHFNHNSADTSQVHRFR